MENKRTILTLSHLRWDFVYQRPQHLLSRLAKSNRVIFIEEPVRADSPHWEFKQPESNILVCRPYTPAAAPGFHDEQLPYLDELMRTLIKEQNINECVLWFYTPMALPVVRRLRPQAVVYDCMDELSAFLNAPA